LTGPPLGSVFSLTGRPAPGLYAGAWLSTLLGAGLLGVALAASFSGNPVGAGLLVTLSFAVFFVAAVLAGGYQAIMRRATLGPERYRGPSPFLVFAGIFAAANAAGAVVTVAGLDAPVGSAGRALVSVAIVVPLYALLVWLLVVREGALGWSEMGWPTTRRTWGRAIIHLGYGAASTLPVIIVTVILGALLASYFQVTPPALLPLPVTLADWLVDIVLVVVLAPIGEELFYRGFAQTAWTRDLGWRSALIRASVFFALVHVISTTGVDFSEGLRLAVVAAVVRLPVSFGLGWVFARTGSIAAPIGLHAGFNGLMLVLAASLGAS